MYKVMIVEDDVTIARILAHNMRKWGLDTYIVKDFSSVTKEFFKGEATYYFARYYTAFF